MSQKSQDPMSDDVGVSASAIASESRAVESHTSDDFSACDVLRSFEYLFRAKSYRKVPYLA
jgi:hypothetical protein